MINTKVYGFQGEGRTLCQSCAERIYGNSLEMYLAASDIQVLSDQDRTTYASKGLLCDDCLSWIFQPKDIEDSWWRVDPEPADHLRLLAPYAVFLKTLQIDVMNLRELSEL